MASSVGTEESGEIGERMRRTDHVFYAKSCHEPDGIYHGIERMAFIGVKLGYCQYLPPWWRKGQWPYTSKHRYDRNVPNLSKGELATMSQNCALQSPTRMLNAR